MAVSVPDQNRTWAQGLTNFRGARVLLAHFPLLLIEGFFEGRLDYGKQREGMPLWMRINSRPVKVSFTLAFTYLAVVVL